MTGAIIGIIRSDGSVKYIQCAGDGYPEYIMPVLTEFYTNKDKVEKPINSGDIKYLNKNIYEELEELLGRKPEKEDIENNKSNCTEYFDKRKGGNLYYHEIMPLTAPSEESIRSSIAEFCYLFNPSESSWPFKQLELS